jgi:hypothetical protein
MPNGTCSYYIDQVTDRIIEAPVGASRRACHRDCGFNYKPGSSGRNEHIFNNIGKTVLRICDILDKNVGISEYIRVSGGDDKRFDIRNMNSLSINTVRILAHACKTETGHTTNVYNGITTVGLCKDPKNDGEDSVEGFSYFSTTISEYVKTIEFDRSFKKSDKANKFMLQKIEIEKRVVDKGALHSAGFLLIGNIASTATFQAWYNTALNNVVILLSRLHDSILVIRTNIEKYYMTGGE